MPLTKKQELYLDIISVMMNKRYDDIESSEEADGIIQASKIDLENNVKVKYFTNPMDDERILTIEVYIWDEYMFAMKITCKEPVTETDTLDTIDIASYWMYK